MSLSQELKQHFEVIADDTLITLQQVANTARTKLQTGAEPGAKSFASTNTLTSEKAVHSLEQIIFKNRESYQQLINEPAISRVVVVGEAGNKITYYICRTSPVTITGSDIKLASYRSPVGRLASLPLGEELSLPSGTFEVLERAQLRPELISQSWDSTHTILEGDDYGPITIKSLRALLKRVDGDEDLLARLLAEESDSANVLKGIRRNVITRMGLRDQPILDQYQDEIFRLSLDSRLLILGPPGTGKTTTLIRRLGQKLDYDFLTVDELESISDDSTEHAKSWLMFTPTELLKQYVKEAFAREGIPASDQRIRTWSDYRRELARNVFGILRTGSGGGTFVLKDKIEIIAVETQVNAITWFSDFNEWQKISFIDEIRLAAQELSDTPISEISKIGRRLFSIVSRVETTFGTTFTSLNAEVNVIKAMIDEMKKVTDKRIEDIAIINLKRNKNFLDDLAAFIDSLQQTPATDNDEQDDQDGDEEEDDNQPKTGRAAALAAFMQAVRSQARAQARKKGLGKTTRNGKIIEWLGERTLSASELAEVGASLLIQASARRFINPVKKYIFGIPKRYRAFRRLRQGEGKWYRNEGFSLTDIQPLELDIVLLAIFKGSGELLCVPSIVRDIDAPFWLSLRPVHDLYRNQILVDEATDFSPVQIACMAELAHPSIRSFFACGDFNQRLTSWGSRSVEEMKWVFPDIEIKSINVSYRQSRQLNELAKAINLAADGTNNCGVLPENVDYDEVQPVLAEDLPAQADIINWLAKRIVEIESFVQQLPSIAILVDCEERVQSLASVLNVALSNQNIRVVACPNGQVMGQDNDVRVFDIQHIKGLEFEAVFFISIDRLANMYPDLFDKFLYVGATRAATYLGVTCEGKLPASIAGLRPMFARGWGNT